MGVIVPQRPLKAPSTPVIHRAWTGRHRYLLTALLTGASAFFLYYWVWLQWRSLRPGGIFADNVDIGDEADSIRTLALDELGLGIEPDLEVLPHTLPSHINHPSRPQVAVPKVIPLSQPKVDPARLPNVDPLSLPKVTLPKVVPAPVPAPVLKPAPVSLPKPLPPCTRTMLYEMSGLHGFASEFGKVLRVSLLAAHYGYSFIVDDSRWNYGKLQDYFEPFQLDCALPNPNKPLRRITAGRDPKMPIEEAVASEPRWVSSKHVKIRRDIDYLDALFARVFVNSTDLHTLHNYELSTAIPKPPLNGNLTIPQLFLPVFKAEADMLDQLWRPNQILASMIDELRTILGLDVDGQNSPNIVISAHIRLGDKSKELSNYGPQKWAPPGWRPVGGKTASALKWGANRISGYFDAAESLRREMEEEKKLPAGRLPLFLVMSDDTSAAKAMMDAPQARNWSVVSVKQIPSKSLVTTTLPTESSLKNGFSEHRFNNMPLQSRIDEARHFLRDLTVLGRYADGLIFTGSSNVSKLFALVGGAKWVSGPGQPKMRSMDVRWFPTGRYI